jgi:cytochrome c oxidase assembly protein subunit 15
VNDFSSQRAPAADLALARYAKVVVAATFVLIFVGGHTTTSGAGMAFPDWPLSHGSLNPTGWWGDLMQRLEHGHRIIAQFVGLLIGVLCAWVWRSKWAVPVAIGVSIALAVLAKLAGAPREMIAHVGLWSSAAIFTVVLLFSMRRDPSPRPAAVRWVAFAAFIGVCAQAVLGGLRVVIESQGDVATATAYRVFHGCFAQFELCLLVALAAMLSPIWNELARRATSPSIARFAWVTVAAIFLQLVVGATMRHLGAGLAIPTFPAANVQGGWLPTMHNPAIHLNFAHTRIGAIVVAACVLGLAWMVQRRAAIEPRLTRIAWLLTALVAAQILMGLYVIWSLRPPVLTTLHVVNGAALLATTVLLAVRAGRNGAASKVTAPLPTRDLELQEVHG